MLEVTEIERSETEGIAVTAARIIKQGRVVVEAVPLKNFAFAMTIAGVISKTPGLWLTHDARTLRNFWPRVTTQTPSREAQDYHLDRESNPYSYVDPHNDESQKLLAVTEAYMQMDINDDGIAELVKVVCLGETDPSVILDLEESPPYRSSRCRRSPSRTARSAYPCSSACDRFRT